MRDAVKCFSATVMPVLSYKKTSAVSIDIDINVHCKSPVTKIVLPTPH
jgi:hypothetical protein